MSNILETDRRAAFIKFMEYVKVAKNATEAAEGLKGKTVIRFNPDGGDHKVETCSTDEIKSFSGKWFRSRPEKDKNNATRNDFKKCLLTFLGKRSFKEIESEELRKAIEIDNFNDGGHPLSAKRIMAVYNCLKGNSNERDRFAENEIYAKGFGGKELHELVNSRLGINDKSDGYINLQPLSEEDKQTLLNDVKQKARILFDETLVEYGIPECAVFKNMIPAGTDEEGLKKIDGAYKKLIDMREKCKYSLCWIKICKEILLKELYKNQISEWPEVIKSKVDALSEKYGDCSQMIGSMKKMVEKNIWDMLAKDPEVFMDEAKIGEAFNELCEKFVNKAEAMLKAIDDVNPPFSAARKTALRSLVCSDPKFRKTKLLPIYSEHSDCLIPLLNKCKEQNLTMDSFMVECRNAFCSLMAVHDEFRMKIGDYGAEDEGNTILHLFDLASAELNAITGTATNISDAAIGLMEKFLSELNFLNAHADDANTSLMPFDFTAKGAQDAALIHKDFIQKLIEGYGLEELSVAQQASEISKPVASFLMETDNFGIAERRPLNHPIEKALNKNFQIKLLGILDLRSIAPRNEADIDLNKELELLKNDLQRTTTGLKLNGNCIARGLEGNGDGIIQKIADSVRNDAAHGKHAAAILGKFLTQSLPGALTKITSEYKYPYCLNIFDQAFSMQDSNVVRRDDGSYDILIDYEVQFLKFVEPDDGRTIKCLDGSKSGMKYHFNMNLIFDEKGAAEVVFNEKPTFSAIFQESPLTLEESNVVENCKDPQTGISFGEFVCFDENLLYDPTLKELAGKNDSEGLVAYLKDKAISSLDVNNMTRFGLNENFVKVMCRGPKGMPRLTKELIDRLTSAQADVRAAAVASLNQICQAYVDKGWLEKVEINPILNSQFSILN